jgi:Signal transduction histidine kinase
MLAASAVIVGAWFARKELNQHEPHFHDDFNRESYSTVEAKGWKTFGGAWQVVDGTMQNISDDRGAKLINGNADWRDYSVEADVQLLSETGSAGLVVRTNSEEIGVDSYHGYFAGVRNLDDTLELGRADFGWHEFASVPVRSHVHVRVWYHLKIIAHGCVIAAAVTTQEGERAVAAVHDSDCIRNGRFGLKSYSTGAIWRNVDLRPASENDLLNLLDGQKPREPGYPRVDNAGIPFNPAITNLSIYERRFGSMLRELRDNHTDLDATPIADLRLLDPNSLPHVTVHGVVTMVSPILFIQDSSGGIAIPNAHLVIPVQIGDAVEATGEAEMHSFSSVLRNGTVRLLWSHTQIPPVAVTAFQAASGSFEAQFIETEGRLNAIRAADSQSTIFELNAGNQTFLAVARSLKGRDSTSEFKQGSLLRVRGICVTDSAFTGNEVPFAVLMRTGSDVQMLEPPPWWSKRHLVEMAFVMLVLWLVSHMVYTSVKRSQMHAVIAERERIAMEMHDTLSQSFAGLGFQLEAICKEAPPGTAMLSQLESTLDLVRFGHMQARRNIAALRPGNLEELGLFKGLEQTARMTVRGGKATVLMSLRGRPRALPLRVSDALFRIGQEAISNAIRHGQPSCIRIRLLYGKSTVRLTVGDNGRGFSPTGQDAGYGLKGMQQRADEIGSHLKVRSSFGHGTVVTVCARFRRQILSSWLLRAKQLRQEITGFERAV